MSLRAKMKKKITSRKTHKQLLLGERLIQKPYSVIELSTYALMHQLVMVNVFKELLCNV